MDLEMRRNLLRCYYANGNSPTSAIRQYKRENNLIKDPCTASAVTKMIEKFERTYSLLDEKHGAKSLQEERKPLVSEAINEASGRISVRKTSQITGIPPASVYRIMKQSLDLYPYKIHMLQELQPQDFQARMEFGNWLMMHTSLIPRILWSDEAYLHLDGSISRHHCRIWSQTNPRQFMTKSLHPQRVDWIYQ